MDADLTLQKAKKLVCQREAVQEHKELLSDIDKQPIIEYIQREVKHSNQPSKSKNTTAGNM